MKSFFYPDARARLARRLWRQKRQDNHANKSSANSDPGATFLAENAKKEGVTTTASGLQYKVIQSGTGESPKLTDTVKVHYQGTLIDGTIFDSSIQRGQPIFFPVNGVIAGWTEALQLMKVGDKWQLFHPGPTGLRRPESHPGDSAQQRIDLRGGIARHRKISPGKRLCLTRQTGVKDFQPHEVGNIEHSTFNIESKTDAPAVRPHLSRSLRSLRLRFFRGRFRSTHTGFLL